MSSRREKFKTANTLVCLLKALIGRSTTVELRNETFIFGTIESVDHCMSMTISGATITTPDGHQKACDDAQYIHGSNIRYVQIPDDIDISSAIETQVDMMRRKPGEVVRKKPKLSTAEKKLAQKKRIDDAVELMKKKLNMI